ncbi:MAG TPA: reverse transcriptase family protein [Pirellulales bacterium]|nr:reverse transcriptase family protein [Pirellulales bacterium]
MHDLQATTRKLAAALLGGSWAVEELVERGTRRIGRRPRWLAPLAGRIAAVFADRPRPSAATLAKFIACDLAFRRAWEARHEPGLEFVEHDLSRPAMSPCRGRPTTWQVPDLPTPGSLAEWLQLTPGRLDWFADCQGRQRNSPAGPLRHYHYRWVLKRSGGVRLIESPKTRLNQIQRRVLDGILNQIPPHDAAHGFRRGRSIGSFAAPHVGQALVLRFDLQDFFTSISPAKVVACFLTAGYPEAVARLLAGLCTNRLPADVWDDEVFRLHGRRERRHAALQWPHLPQGAPTSPALANLCAYRLDCRLWALADSLRAKYTRYADDLVFSGGESLERAARRLQTHVAAIVLEEGLRVHPRKTRIMRRSVRQQVAGVVVNECMNVRRADYDRLKALLHNCVGHGPASQNHRALPDFRAHLAGRIAHVAMLNPARGAALRRAFEQIAW